MLQWMVACRGRAGMQEARPPMLHKSIACKRCMQRR